MKPADDLLREMQTGRFHMALAVDKYGGTAELITIEDLLDYETFGRDPRLDRPAQFAGIRTDLDLNEVDKPVMLYCKPAPDYLPDPEACLLTGILPQECLAKGLPEYRFADAVLAELGASGTIGVGYNSIRFDDEVTRHLMWRTLRPPYDREWRNGCSR